MFYAMVTSEEKRISTFCLRQMIVKIDIIKFLYFWEVSFQDIFKTIFSHNVEKSEFYLTDVANKTRDEYIDEGGIPSNKCTYASPQVN